MGTNPALDVWQESPGLCEPSAQTIMLPGPGSKHPSSTDPHWLIYGAGLGLLGPCTSQHQGLLLAPVQSLTS